MCGEILTEAQAMKSRDFESCLRAIQTSITAAAATWLRAWCFWSTVQRTRRFRDLKVPRIPWVAQAAGTSAQWKRVFLEDAGIAVFSLR